MKTKVAPRLLPLSFLSLAFACGGSTERPASAADCAVAATASGEVAPPNQGGALPRYFTLELAGHQASVDGSPLQGQALSARIGAEAEDPRNGGALVRLHEGFSGEVLGALVWELSTAGFLHIIVWRPSGGEPPLEPPGAEHAGVTEASAPEAGAVEPRAEVEAAAPSAPAPAESSADVEPDASLRTIGLHVGGGPNDDATRSKFIAPIEQHFDALLRCHVHADKRDQNASVGVDLLIPVRGGKASVKDLRTAIGSEKFQACVRAGFEQVSFPSVARPTMVSYSMLFEPKTDR
jgi:hypothetical protein